METRKNLPPSDILISPRDSLIVVGYPLDFYDPAIELPIARTAALSTPYCLNYRGKKLFLIDSILHSGTSGSPVIFDPRIMLKTLKDIAIGNNRHPIILGVHSGEDPTAFDYKDIELNDTWYSWLIPEILGARQQW